MSDKTLEQRLFGQAGKVVIGDVVETHAVRINMPYGSDKWTEEERENFKRNMETSLFGKPRSQGNKDAINEILSWK